MSIQGMPSLVAVVLTAGMIALVPTARAEEGRRPSFVNPSPPRDPSSPGRRYEERSIINFKDGRLSVRVQNRPLEWVLEEISREGRVAIIRADGVGGERVSVQFQDLPLDEGLRQILKEKDAFFFYGVEEKPPASLRAIWIYPSRRGRGLAPVPPETWASTKELEGRLTEPDPQARSQAVEALVERKGDRALDVVLQALRDADEQVRSWALYSALSAGVELPTDSLIDLALHDPSHNVRFLALEALATDPNVRTVGEQALNDPSPHVRRKAQEILETLKGGSASTESPEPSQPVQGQREPQGQ